MIPDERNYKRIYFMGRIKRAIMEFAPTYGGKLTENITQAGKRLPGRRHGEPAYGRVPINLHIHDEVILENSQGRQAESEGGNKSSCAGLRHGLRGFPKCGMDSQEIGYKKRVGLAFVNDRKIRISVGTSRKATSWHRQDSVVGFRPTDGPAGTHG